MALSCFCFLLALISVSFPFMLASLLSHFGSVLLHVLLWAVCVKALYAYIVLHEVNVNKCLGRSMLSL